jgi:hypothetical protein
MTVAERHSAVSGRRSQRFDNKHPADILLARTALLPHSWLDRMRLVSGAAQLMLPRQICALVWRGRSHRHERVLLQVVGVRRIVQALLSHRYNQSGPDALGMAVESGHAASMVALALVSRRCRRFALTSAAVAGCWAAASAKLASRR